MACSPQERRAWENFEMAERNRDKEVKEAKRNSRELNGETKKQKHENQDRTGF